jgi:hypothetical protein
MITRLWRVTMEMSRHIKPVQEFFKKCAFSFLTFVLTDQAPERLEVQS